MKLLKYTLALIIYVGMMVGCSEGWEEIEIPTLNVTRMTITETIPSDGGEVDKKEEFIYKDAKLIKHTTTQEFSFGQSISTTTTLNYAGNEVTVTDEAGNAAIYILDHNGYATQCTYQLSSQTRGYTFTYDNGYLTQIDETIDRKPTMSNILTYKRGELTSIYNSTNTLICQAGTITNYSKLPCLILTDIYPLSLHTTAIYAHILGKPTQHLVTYQAPDTEDGEESTTYTYKIDNAGRVTNINAKLTYKGVIVPPEDPPYESGNTTKRTLVITYD